MNVNFFKLATIAAIVWLFFSMGFLMRAMCLTEGYVVSSTIIIILGVLISAMIIMIAMRKFSLQITLTQR
ncbi:MAG: hypothetical protein KBC62_04625 [Candidatus Pacebacteria bacterium]|nr:hypothetical protein [Candidatus Paceibacterota bacterium]